MVLIQEVSTFTFRMADTILIGGGLVSVISGYFYIKFKADGTSKELDDFKKEYEKESIAMAKNVDKVFELYNQLNKTVVNKLEQQNESIHSLSTQIKELEIKILEKITNIIAK